MKWMLTLIAAIGLIISLALYSSCPQACQCYCKVGRPCGCNK